MHRCCSFVYIFVLILALALTGCSDGSSAADGPVEVSLALGSSSEIASRVVGVNEPVDTSKLAFYYSAAPMWTGYDFATAQGSLTVSSGFRHTAMV